MRELFGQYGKTVLAAAASGLLIGLSAVFLSDGQVFEVIQAFSQKIC